MRHDGLEASIPRACVFCGPTLSGLAPPEHADVYPSRLSG